MQTLRVEWAAEFRSSDAVRNELSGVARLTYPAHLGSVADLVQAEYEHAIATLFPGAVAAVEVTVLKGPQ